MKGRHTSSLFTPHHLDFGPEVLDQTAHPEREVMMDWSGRCIDCGINTYDRD